MQDQEKLEISKLFGIALHKIKSQNKNFAEICLFCNKKRNTIAKFNACNHWSCPECLDDFVDNTNNPDYLFKCLRCNVVIQDVTYHSIN